MRLGHSRCRAPLATTERSQRQGGYVLVQFALLLVPLLLLAGFSVDVGYWYNRVSNLQKAADAAALAGVVWLPNESNAETYALEAAARNGFVDGVAGIEITVEPAGERRLRVTIRDPQVTSFFFQALGGHTIDLGRSGTAEYILRVPLGSPHNFFGTGTLVPPEYGSYRENLWLSVNTWCTDKVDGDRHQSRYSGNRPYGDNSCSRGSSFFNSEYRDTGYEFYVDVPGNRTASIPILLYDARYRPEAASPDLGLFRGSDNHDFTFTVFGADDTPLDDSDNPLVSGCSKTFNRNTAFDYEFPLGEPRWNRLCTITQGMKAGRYVVRVTNTAGSGPAAGANNFSVAAPYEPAGRFTAGLCDSRVTANCPRVYGKDAISVFAGQSSSTADFYLAEIEPIHAGKTMRIELFDPGEGGNNIRILRPNGANSWAEASFRWTVDGGASGGPTTSLDVTGSKFDGKTVRVAVELTGYSPPSNNRWWKIRYNFGSGKVTDRTTWSVNITGDPVHLVEEEEVS